MDKVIKVNGGVSNSLNELLNDGWKVVQAIAMGGDYTNIHPYIVYVLRKENNN